MLHHQACADSTHNLAVNGATTKLSKQHPNLLLIIVDTLRSDALGLYGNSANPTPAIDELAKSGIVFENVIAPCSWTRPSIGTILTSKNPRTLGLFEEKGERLAESETTLAEILRGNGYATFGATANPNINSLFGFHQGFDEYIDSKVLFEWMPKSLNAEVETQQPLHSANNLFADALQFARDASTRPTYLQLCIMEMHQVRKRNSMTRSEYKERFTGKPNGDYLGTAAQVSRDIGAFIQELKSVSDWKDSVIVILSDHGEGLDDHPGLKDSEWHGFFLYQSTIAVPWIIVHPSGGKASTRVGEQVGLIDVVPTLLPLLDVKTGIPFAGRNVLSNGERGRDRVYMVETYFRGRQKFGMYTTMWKLFVNKDEIDPLPRIELYRRKDVELFRVNNVATENPGHVRNLVDKAGVWEREFPPAHPTPVTDGIDESVADQLRSIGYL